MSKFEGITNEYRSSDEYKSFVKSIKEDFPEMPLYLIELAISTHKNDPQAYKQYQKAEKNLGKQKIGNRSIDTIIDDAVKIYNDLNDLPQTEMIKIREIEASTA
jgi:hypothetical protein